MLSMQRWHGAQLIWADVLWVSRQRITQTARKRAAHALAAAPKSFASAAGAASSKPVLKIVPSAPLMVTDQRLESHEVLIGDITTGR